MLLLYWILLLLGFFVRIGIPEDVTVTNDVTIASNTTNTSAQEIPPTPVWESYANYPYLVMLQCESKEKIMEMKCLGLLLRARFILIPWHCFYQFSLEPMDDPKMSIIDIYSNHLKMPKCKVWLLHFAPVESYERVGPSDDSANSHPANDGILKDNLLSVYEPQKILLKYEHPQANFYRNRDNDLIILSLRHGKLDVTPDMLFDPKGATFNNDEVCDVIYYQDPKFRVKVRVGENDSKNSSNSTQRAQVAHSNGLFKSSTNITDINECVSQYKEIGIDIRKPENFICANWTNTENKIDGIYLVCGGLENRRVKGMLASTLNKTFGPMLFTKLAMYNSWIDDTIDPLWDTLGYPTTSSLGLQNGTGFENGTEFNRKIPISTTPRLTRTDKRSGHQNSGQSQLVAIQMKSSINEIMARSNNGKRSPFATIIFFLLHIDIIIFTVLLITITYPTFWLIFT